MMRIMIAISAVMISCSVASAMSQTAEDNKEILEMTSDDFRIVSDELKDGVRYVTAVPSARVCSVRIDIEIKDGMIMKVEYTKGCDGNAKGIGALIKGMSVEEAVRRLSGITCGRKDTSCPDQLARILKKL